jgi:hypothetical protein
MCIDAAAGWVSVVHVVEKLIEVEEHNIEEEGKGDEGDDGNR